VKLLSSSGVILQQLTGLELRSVLVGEAIHHIDIISNADLIEITERATTERSKPGSKDETNVSDDRILDNTVLQALGGLIDESVQVIRQ
jgi:hypothetical protein